MTERERLVELIKDLVERDVAKNVKWENGICSGRICPTCGHVSYYCASRDEASNEQPDNFCSKCGQRFVEQSEQNDVQAANDKQAKYLLVEITRKFDEQNGMLKEQNVMIDKILKLLGDRSERK